MIFFRACLCRQHAVDSPGAFVHPTAAAPAPFKAVGIDFTDATATEANPDDLPMLSLDGGGKIIEDAEENAEEDKKGRDQPSSELTVKQPPPPLWRMSSIEAAAAREMARISAVIEKDLSPPEFGEDGDGGGASAKQTASDDRDSIESEQNCETSEVAVTGGQHARISAIIDADILRAVAAKTASSRSKLSASSRARFSGEVAATSAVERRARELARIDAVIERDMRRSLQAIELEVERKQQKEKEKEKEKDVATVKAGRNVSDYASYSQSLARPRSHSIATERDAVAKAQHRPRSRSLSSVPPSAALVPGEGKAEQPTKTKTKGKGKKAEVCMDRLLFGAQIKSSVSAKRAADRWLAARSARMVVGDGDGGGVAAGSGRVAAQP